MESKSKYIVENNTYHLLFSKNIFASANIIYNQIQTSIDICIEKISNDKGIHKNQFLEWKGYIMSSVDVKIHTMYEITCRLVKFIFSEHKVKDTMLACKDIFVIVPIDKAGNNVRFIC